MYTLKVKTHFDAAHKISDYVGKCKQLHGHRWDVEIVLYGVNLDSKNILVDFKDVKKSLRNVIDDTLDHTYLNELFDEPNVTAEFLAKRLFGTLSKCNTWADFNTHLESVTVWESPECSVTYEDGLI